MRISDWSSDVCSSDLGGSLYLCEPVGRHRRRDSIVVPSEQEDDRHVHLSYRPETEIGEPRPQRRHRKFAALAPSLHVGGRIFGGQTRRLEIIFERSEEHTSELQSLMRTSYAVFCLKKKTHSFVKKNRTHDIIKTY